MTIHEQIKNFADAAEGLRGEISQEEMAAMATDIANTGGKLWEYHNMIEEDALRLKVKADGYYRAADLQKKKAHAVKNYLKFALKSNGFTKLKVDDFQITLSEIRKAVPKRVATEQDFYAHPTWVKPSLSWASTPTMEQWNDHPDLVKPEFAWDVAKLKSEGKEELLEYEVSTRLTVKIAREN
jgi:hypothetical protein